jgi:mRNA interferase HigB
VFNIIARKILLDYSKKYPEARNGLLGWYHELEKSNFKNLNELKSNYPDASIIGDNRIIFNILGNKYRLIVRVIFNYKAIQIKWFGTHSEYNKVDALTVQNKK